MPFSFNHTALIDLRQNAGVNQCQVAKEIGENKSEISRLENKKYVNPPIKIVCKLARYFKVKIAHFKTGEAL